MLKTIKWHLLMFFKCDAVNETGKTQMVSTAGQERCPFLRAGVSTTIATTLRKATDVRDVTRLTVLLFV